MLPKFLSTLAVFSVAFFSLSVAQAQESIQDQFEEFYQKETSNWEEYKLIKRPKLRTFWQLVSDTLTVKQQAIGASRTRIKSLEVELDSAYAMLDDTNAQLAASKTLNDSIGFLGIFINKAAYNIAVWAIIFALVGAAVALYLMFLRGNSVTKKTLKSYSELEREHGEHKNTSREKQAKLKRELQTALNTLQENRINF